MQEVTLCPIHNQPVLLYDKNIPQPEQNRLCLICLQKRDSNLRTVEEENYDQQKNLNLIREKFQKNIHSLKGIIDDVNKYKQTVLVTIDKMLSTLMQSLQKMEELTNQLQLNQNVEDCQMKIGDMNEKISYLIHSQLKVMQSVIKIDTIIANIQQLTKAPFEEKDKDDFFKYHPFEYKLLEKASKKQSDYCYAIAFNQDSSLIFYASGNTIKENQFKNGYILTEMQELKAHSKNVTCLHYMNISQELVSAGLDNLIIIWSRDEQNLWTIKQVLNEHKKLVNCIVINLTEDLLISGSDDNTIKFWGKNNEWTCQQTIEQKFHICGLSLNDSQNKLIASSDEESKILVISSLLHNEWKIVQEIEVQNHGIRLSFIDQNLFIFQPDESEQLQIYEFDKEKKQFNKTKVIEVKSSSGECSFFPCQFIKSKQILIVKNNTYINIIRRQENGKFINQQSINVQTDAQFGRATNDGEYLVVQDDQTKSIQVRKLEYIK